MFLFKKIAALFLFPLPLTLLCLITGIFLLWFSKKQKTGKIIITLGIILLAISSFKITSDAMLRLIEYKYAAFSGKTEYNRTQRKPAFVVVLGGGHISSNELPLLSQIGSASLARLVEGIRIQRKIKGSKLLLSGGKVFDPVSNAEIMSEVAKAIGVNEKDIIMEADSRDTKDQARIIKSIVGDKKFVLVTSASHMPRSMALFKKMGMDPIPAATGHLVVKSNALSPSAFFPSSGNIEKTESAVHERLGLIWAKLKGQI
ncbi:MAG: envelope biogenesis factor ElyC [Candidatus Omnitrophica bacterium]|nr:envelope biogenesis factor ElyC [Candidatus Omnitrophota bacterium]